MDNGVEMKAKIFHNPRCSKSRKTLELLLEKEVETEIVEYLKKPPDCQTLKDILKMLDLKPFDLVRTGEKLYKELDVGKYENNTDALLKIMTQNPILIERPIVIANNKAVIGRPPELVLNII
jgi:arsenate reductase